MVELLLANKAAVNAAANNGYTPLHMAAGLGHKDIAELLLASQANVNAEDGNGLTPFQYALDKGQKGMAELLRQHGGHK
jgi:ankyrin repeat protein